MSHMVDIEDVKIISLQALKKACKRLGLQFKEDNSARYYGGSYNCDFVISVPGSDYDIAVVNQGDFYTLKADFWGSNGEILKKAVNGIKQIYSIELMKEIARRKGYSPTTEQKMSGNRIKLRIRVP